MRFSEKETNGAECPIAGHGWKGEALTRISHHDDEPSLDLWIHNRFSLGRSRHPASRDTCTSLYIVGNTVRIPLHQKIYCDKSVWNGFGPRSDPDGVKYKDVFHQSKSLRDHLAPR